MFFKVLWFLQSIGDKIGGETLTALGKQGEATISKLCLYDYYMLPAPTQPLSANLSLLPSYLRDQDGFFGFVGQFLHFFRFFRVSCGTGERVGTPFRDCQESMIPQVVSTHLRSLLRKGSGRSHLFTMRK